MSSDENWEQILEHVTDGVYVVDADRRITFWNRGAEQITGYRRDEVLGRRCSDNILMHVDGNGDELCVVGCPVHATLGDGQHRDGDLYLRHKEGYRLPVRINVSAMHDENGRVVAAVETFSDRSHTEELSDRVAALERQVLVDSLTSLANRRHCEQQLESLLEEMRRYNWSFGAMFIDIDHFKQTNDLFGHAAGDHVLYMVGRVLRMNSRAFDVVSRWGGEEFVLACPHVDAETLAQTAERLRMLVEVSRVTVDDAEFSATVSIGATMGRADDSLESLIARADAAMYRSKEAGRNRITFA